MKLRLTPAVRRQLRIRVQAASQRTDALNLCAELARYAERGADLRDLRGLTEIAAEQWVTATELEEVTLCLS